MLAVRMLSRFEIHYNRQPIEITSGPAQSLLAYLIYHADGAHRRDRLAGLLWPESSEQNARSSLRHALWRARKAIPAAYIAADRSTIAFLRHPPFKSDVETLTQPLDKESTIEQLIEVASVYRGDLLPGFYEEWITLERDRLDAVYGDRMGQLLGRLEEEQRWREVRQWAETWIARGQTPEPAYRALMLACAGMGDRSGAVQAYERCVATLEEELATTPSAETTALLASIRAGEVLIQPSSPREPGTDHSIDTGARSGGDKPNPTNRRPVGELPTPITPFIGRQKELARLMANLAERRNRLVTVLGTGGMGKTRLAIAAGQRLVSAYRDGVHFVSLATANNAEEMVQAIASTVGYTFESDNRGALAQLIGYLKGQDVLLILDNMEHLIGEAPVITELLQGAPGIQAVMTSRERIQLGGEQVLTLQGMAYPTEEEDNLAGDAVALFLDCAGRQQSTLADDSETRRAIGRICRLVGGMPLAIVLAAGWLDMLEPGEIADQLERSNMPLEDQLQDLPDRQRNIKLLLTQTWRRLDQEERSLYTRLATFQGGFTLEAAQKITGTALLQLRRLSNRGLLWREDNGRFQIHELLRQFSLEKRSDGQVEDSVRHLHAQHYFGQVAALLETIYTAQSPETCRRMEMELGNVRAAFAYACQKKDSSLLDLGFEGMMHFLDWQRYWEGGLLLTGMILQALADRSEPSAVKLSSCCRIWHGYFLFRTGAPLAGRKQLVEAQTMLTQLEEGGEDTRREQAQLHWMAGTYLYLAGTRQAMEDRSQKALVLYRACGNAHGTIMALLSTARVTGMLKSERQAEQMLEACLDLCQEAEHLYGAATAEVLQSSCLRQQGRFEEAQQHYERSKDLTVMLGKPEHSLDPSDALPVLLTFLGEFDQVEAHQRHLIETNNARGFSAGRTAWNRLYLGHALLHQGRYKESVAQLRQAATDQQAEIGRVLAPTPNFLAMASLAQTRGDDTPFLDMLLSQIEGQKAESVGFKALILVSLADVGAWTGDLDKTTQAVSELLPQVEQGAFYVYTLMVLPACTVLLAGTGEPLRALECHTTAMRYPFVSRSRYYQRLTESALVDILSRLSPDTVGRAKDIGRARTLPETTTELAAILAAS